LKCLFFSCVISVVGVLKSILQVFVGMFAFDRLAINYKTILGIILSLIGGTVFSYLEYTNKQTKSTINIIENNSQQQIKTDEITTNTEKFVHSFEIY
jgi:uncharacterized membrane protein YraQ (UPF0718 family)